MHDATPCEYGHTMFVNDIKRLWSLLPVQDTLILASEDIEDNLDSILKRLLTFANNITLSKESIEEFRHVRYNTQVSQESKMIRSKTRVEQMVTFYC